MSTFMRGLYFYTQLAECPVLPMYIFVLDKEFIPHDLTGIRSFAVYLNDIENYKFSPNMGHFGPFPPPSFPMPMAAQLQFSQIYECLYPTERTLDFDTS